MADNDLWRLSATETAKRTRAGDITAEQAVASSITRMNAVNPALNAIVEDLSGEAMERARALDKARAGGAAPGALHGVPLTIKINVDQAGHATSNGVAALKDLIAPDDAPVVKNLEAAGAVVIGRSNTPEFSFRADTDNPLFGRTHNPWGAHISAGGSSGGAGSAVAAGIGPLAHGNDIGGSLRYPSAANGVVTVKPGLGRVPAWNPSQKAERGMLAQNMSVQGLITRHAEDLHLAMPAMIAPDPRDPFHVPLPWRGDALEGRIKVGFSKETFDFDLHPEVSAALDTARDALTDAGYQVDEVEPPLLRECALDGYRALMSEVQQLMGSDLEVMGSTVINDIFAENYRQFAPLEPVELLQVLARRTHYARQWSLLLEEYPLFLSPFMPQPYFSPGRDAEGAEGLREALGSGLWSYSMNFMGLPAGNVPARLAQLPKGPQPINVQIIARRWREDLAVDACQAIQDRVGRMSGALWKLMEA
jgi:amidase